MCSQGFIDGYAGSEALFWLLLALSQKQEWNKNMATPVLGVSFSFVEDILKFNPGYFLIGHC